MHSSVSIVEALMSSAKNLKILQMPRLLHFSAANAANNALSFDLSRVSEFNNLTILNLEKNINVDNDFLIKLSDKCKELLKINIRCKELVFHILCTFSLHYYNLLFYIIVCQYVTNRGLRCVTTLPKLQVLYIDGLKNISDEVLTHIPELQTLSCASCDNIHYVGLITLITTSEKLKNLYVCNCKLITNDFLDAALEATKYRKKSVLTIFVHGTSINKFTESSFLKINREYTLVTNF